MLAAHRKTPNRTRERFERAWALVAQKLGNRIICPRCQATCATFADVCAADLDDACPGFMAIDNAQAEAMREVGA